MATPGSGELLESAQAVRSALLRARLALDIPGVEAIRSERQIAVAQLDDHVLPRLANLDAPALIVVGGSTGAGKSTLVNSLIGDEVTKPGVLRPTTRAPVLVCNPASAHWFSDQRILPDLARVSGPDPSTATGSSSHRELELVIHPNVPDELAILDAPDVDSIVTENRELATQLLAAADLWVFVTTAARYADAVPWDHLRTAAARGISLVLVLNRVPAGAMDAIRPHLASMLAEHGLGGVHIYGIEEQPLVEGRIDATAVGELRSWLATLAADSTARDLLVRQTLRGVISDLAMRCETIADAVDSQQSTIDSLTAAVTSSFDAGRRELMADVRDGAVLRGEVLDRWQDVVGTGELLRQLESKLGRLRDKVTAALTGRPPASEKFTGALESGVAVLARRRVADSAAATQAIWSQHPAGAQLIAAAAEDLTQPSTDLDDRVAAAIRDWQGGLVDMLRTEGANKRSTARFLSYGVNGSALVLMVAVFAQTGGLTGAEVAIAGGTSAVGTKLLEALLGDQAVRRLAEQAREDLDRRISVVLDREAQRFTSQLATIEMDVESAGALRVAARRLVQDIRAGGLEADAGAASSGRDDRPGHAGSAPVAGGSALVGDVSTGQFPDNASLLAGGDSTGDTEEERR